MKYRITFAETVRYEAVIESDQPLDIMAQNEELTEDDWFPAVGVIDQWPQRCAIAIDDRWVDDVVPCGPEATNPPTGTNYGT